MKPAEIEIPLAKNRAPVLRRALPLIASAAGALALAADQPAATPATDRAPHRMSVASGRQPDRDPVRVPLGLRLVKLGWTYSCMECHKVIEAKWHRHPAAVEHEHIRLEHGENRFCLNCHHATNRNVFSDYDGSEIPESDVVRLCSKCHGTVYRDWRAGIHGRRNGHWDIAVGSRSQLVCIQCHDPHAPKFPSMKPLAPPPYPARAAYAPRAADRSPGGTH